MDTEGDGAPFLVGSGPEKSTHQPSNPDMVVRVPLSIITGRLESHDSVDWRNSDSRAGYLGAGKTTLVNYVLKEEHGKKIAVILNGLYTLWRSCRAKILANCVVQNLATVRLLFPLK